MTTKKEQVQMWLAAVLTAGEWTIALYVMVHQGEIVMLYLAVTYAIRETTGGKHYHEILIEAIQKVRRKQ
jgi:hypothetical protein